MTNEQIADELERRAKRVSMAEEREQKTIVAWNDQELADIVIRNLPAILRALRAEPDAGEVERAAIEMLACEADRYRAAGIPERAIVPWDRLGLDARHARLGEMQRVLHAARSRP